MEHKGEGTSKDQEHGKCGSEEVERRSEQGGSEDERVRRFFIAPGMEEVLCMLPPEGFNNEPVGTCCNFWE